MIDASPTSILSHNVSRETFSPMAAYVALLLKWNSKINLIGPMTESDIWSRHIDDSLQLLPLIPEGVTSLADLGSGAGLPGLVIAIARPDLAITLVEQDQRKAAFLNEAKRVLGLMHVTVEAINIAKLTAQYDVVTARALSSLTQLLAMARPLMHEASIGIFPKGANYQAELDEATTNWRFSHRLQPSKTNVGSAIITISKLTSISAANR